MKFGVRVFKSLPLLLFTLVCPPGGVANHDWQYINPHVVQVSALQGAGQHEPPIAAAQIEYDRRSSTPSGV